MGTTRVEWSMALAFAIVLMLNVSANAQTRQTPHTLSLDSPAATPAATIHDVAWIAGYWESEAFGGTAEEVWSEPNAGTMMGMYKLVRGGAVVFYEILAIVEDGHSLVLKLKHFNPDLSGWEEKDESVDFPLVRLEPGAAYFDGLTFQREHADMLRVFLRTRKREGGFSEHQFLYRRASPAASARGEAR